MKWRPIDSAIAAILIANVLLLAAVVVWPTEPVEDPSSSSGKGSESSSEQTGAETDPAASKVLAAPAKRIPLLPRNRLWKAAQKYASEGELDKAIDSLKRLLREEPRLGEVPRRAIWLQLSYYAGIAGREEDARRWLRLSKASLERGLVPDELLRLAKEAQGAKDWVESRRYAARFLLQQEQLGSDARKGIAEAYMMLGDGYRQEAGVEAAAAHDDKSGPKKAGQH